MGVAINELIVKREISIDELSGKIMVVDGPLWMYQFLSSIRQPDGSLLSDSKGNVTSHLIGLSSRVPKLMEKNIKLAFCFDGKVPDLKKQERERRKEVKIAAERRYEEAVKKKDIEDMKKYAARTTRLTKEMIDEAKRLLEALGIPVIDAPSEAEAQASNIVKNKDAFAVATSDADVLMFGATRLVRNLNIAGKRKKTNKLVYETVKPEIVDLAENLNTWGIDNEQLIVLSMLVGTDYNIGGIKGIGPKNALKLVKKYDSKFDELFREVKWDENFSYPWTEVFGLIKDIPVIDDYKLEWKDVDKEKLFKILVDEHNFSEERVNHTMDKLVEKKEEKKQTGLSQFF
ncbi:MAG: flap endonuclease-1 [Nanoarchaeota archaeon]|nr:flap endonuclease-1 [Nanoarchaeota archaeon]MBU1004385.1 flap endonuclease-1 [Nanoarchaeota archaeon]MBU1946728.1 flap endonuclease-1 [Nanoarchaeota archaeon]